MLFSPARCLLAAASIAMGPLVNAATDNVLEVDLVFPRNDTYAPTEWFPVVFAFRNAERARFLSPHIDYTIWDWDNMFGNGSRNTGFTHDLRYTNWSSHEPYFVYKFFDAFRTEGHWFLKWTLTWQSCTEDSFANVSSPGITYKDATWAIHFTIANSAPKVDLVAATANKTCPEELGLAFNVTDQTVKKYDEECALLASSSPNPTPNPCLVQIDSAIAASMSASWTARLCSGLNPPPDCPEDDEDGAQRLAVAGVSCLLATLGAFWFILL